MSKNLLRRIGNLKKIERAKWDMDKWYIEEMEYGRNGNGIGKTYMA